MEGILFCCLKIGTMLNGRYFILGLGCLMEGILFWEDRLLNGRYFILRR